MLSNNYHIFSKPSMQNLNINLTNIINSKFKYHKLLSQDSFQKSNTVQISFKSIFDETEEDKINRRELIQEIKMLYRDQRKLLPIADLIDEINNAFIFQQAIKQGLTIDEILKKSKLKDFNPDNLTKIVYGKTVKEHLQNHIELYKRIINARKLEFTTRKETMPNHIYENYLPKAILGNSCTGDPNYSESFRYPYLSTHLSEMVDKNIHEGRKTKFLIVGLGKRANELYDDTLYAYIGAKRSDTNIGDAIDIEMVDYRDRDSLSFDYLDPSRLDKIYFNKYLIKHPEYKEYKTYPFEVLDYVIDTFEDEKKLHHSTPIETFAKSYEGDGYDFVSLNNVLQYIGFKEIDTSNALPDEVNFVNPLKIQDYSNPESFYKFRETLENILKMVKPGGLLSCSIVHNLSKKLYDQLEKIDLFNKEFIMVGDDLYKRKEK